MNMDEMMLDDINTLNLFDDNTEEDSIYSIIEDVDNAIQDNHEFIDELAELGDSEEILDTYNLNESTIDNTEDLSSSERSQVSFGAKYSDSEIRAMRRDVSDLERDLSYAKSEVRHQERMVDLSDTDRGHRNGDYSSAKSRLSRATAKYNDIVNDLNKAKSRLNNAL